MVVLKLGIGKMAAYDNAFDRAKKLPAKMYFGNRVGCRVFVFAGRFLFKFGTTANW